MNVKQLIDKLEKVADKDIDVWVAWRRLDDDPSCIDYQSIAVVANDHDSGSVTIIGTSLLPEIGSIL